MNMINCCKDTRAKFFGRRLFSYRPMWLAYDSMEMVALASDIVLLSNILRRISPTMLQIHTVVVLLNRLAVQLQWWTWPTLVQRCSIAFGWSNRRTVIFIWKRIFWFALTHSKTWVNSIVGVSSKLPFNGHLIWLFFVQNFSKQFKCGHSRRINISFTDAETVQLAI